MPYDPSGSLPVGQNPFAGSGASQLAQAIARSGGGEGNGFPSFTGGLPDPDWANTPDPRYADFRHSPNVDDRRNDATPVWLRNLLGELTPQNSNEEMMQAVLHPMTKIETNPVAPVTPLGVQAGMLQIEPLARQIAAQRAAEAQALVQADPNVHSFNEPIDPNGPPVSLDRRKVY